MTCVNYNFDFRTGVNSRLGFKASVCGTYFVTRYILFAFVQLFYGCFILGRKCRLFLELYVIIPRFRRCTIITDSVDIICMVIDLWGVSYRFLSICECFVFFRFIFVMCPLLCLYLFFCVDTILCGYALIKGFRISVSISVYFAKIFFIKMTGVSLGQWRASIGLSYRKINLKNIVSEV